MDEKYYQRNKKEKKIYYQAKHKARILARKIQN